jgi:hypothetical protein
LKDGSPTLGCHPSIGAIGIHEDLRQAGSLELGGWPILFVYRPIANQPESQPTSIRSDESPRFDEELGWQRESGRLSPIFRSDDNASHLHPLHNVSGVKRSICLDHTMHVAGDGFGWDTLGRLCLLA